MLQLAFEQPAMLWFLFSIPLLIFTHLYFMRHARAKAIRFGNFHAIERVTGERLLTKNALLLALRCLVIVCLIFAAAGTTLWHDSRESTSTVLIVIDTSASMTTNDMNGTRLDAAKRAATEFVNELDGATTVGVVRFSGLSEVVIAPTRDKEAVLAAIDSIRIQTAGGTDLAGAITTGTNVLSTARNGRMLILLTDGVSSFSISDEDPLPRAIAHSVNHHVIVHTIGVGTQSVPGSAFIPQLQETAATFDEQNLEEIATATGGTYAWARNQQQLRDAYGAITAEGSTAVLPVKLSYGFLFVALLLLFLEWGLTNTRYRILP
jgi:Ca-activated chloride channel homolog